MKIRCEACGASSDVDITKRLESIASRAIESAVDGNEHAAELLKIADAYYRLIVRARAFISEGADDDEFLGDLDDAIGKT